MADAATDRKPPRLVDVVIVIAALATYIGGLTLLGLFILRLFIASDDDIGRLILLMSFFFIFVIPITAFCLWFPLVVVIKTASVLLLRLLRYHLHKHGAPMVLVIAANITANTLVLTLLEKSIEHYNAMIFFSSTIFVFPNLVGLVVALSRYDATYFNAPILSAPPPESPP